MNGMRGNKFLRTAGILLALSAAIVASNNISVNDAEARHKPRHVKPVQNPVTTPEPEPSIEPAQRGTLPPPPEGFSDIQLLGPSATLPSIETCRARVHYSSWEPRRQNNGGDGFSDENHNTSDLIIPNVDGVDRNQSFYMNRIAAANAANFTGTTDELIQFYSCYWGVDDNSTRAKAMNESTWDQDVNGDRQCFSQGVSWGLLQVKDNKPRGCGSGPHDATYPDTFVSTGNNLNYALAWQVACYRGDMSWAAQNRGSMRRCIGMWFSGNPDGGYADYLASYDRHLSTRPWLSASFPTMSIGQTCRSTSCDTLPRD